MWNGLSLAVVLPTYNEHLSIRECIEQFEELGVVDRILVVNNNAHPDTPARVATTSAIEVHETLQGYGAAIRRGFAETARFDLVCVCEPDGTFVPSDLLKLLSYAADVDIVFGSRTVQTFIFSGANMGRFLRYGNWAVAKLTEILFDTVSLSDVGCTFRVVSRKAIDTMSPSFRSVGSDFGFEMMLSAAAMRIPMVQIPVHYQARVGRSSVTGNRWVAMRLGLSMIALCLKARIAKRRRVGSTGNGGD
ncbi:MAG: glycosyl transferase [Acidimicrobiales bacterium mtb01]|nr:glycosyltransferase family 2 protein [Actinomycetota bacterium]TEX47797.1 MAG: glycosyl transferase [Acidimicrobiales bacterium mtb01]